LFALLVGGAVLLAALAAIRATVNRSHDFAISASEHAVAANRGPQGGATSRFGHEDAPSPPSRAGDALRVDFLQKAEELNRRQIPGGGGLLGETWELLREWVVADPQAALSYCLGPGSGTIRPEFFALADKAIALWASRDLAAARNFVQENADQNWEVDKLAPALMEVYAAIDPSGARHWLGTGFESDSSELRPRAASEYIRLRAGDPQNRPEIAAWLSTENVASSAYAQPAVEQMVAILGREDLASAIAFTRGLPAGTGSRNIAWREAIYHMAKRDPAEAHAWVSSMLEMVESRHDSPASDDALSLQEIDYAIAGIALAQADGSSLESALANIEAIEDASLRQRTRDRILALRRSGIQ
jgi:hypothetical protein